MPRVTAKVLADQLVTRRALTPAHRDVRYALAPYAKTLTPVFNALLKWGVRHLARWLTAEG